ncbi:MAG: bifunctional 4-hydroxy-2-oxoglutarate aldolase/2-dehydro-3-deoxy-phosphogluconate aldolase [Pirellulaceae bacterium]|nr:bifunctional 4-hydroxy-2-oxoglutarate aldolase/2-dehydro-3-deoxy-phosphogluconate aldolase [Pirellulaceae bacterium]
MTQLPAEIFARIERTGILAVLVVDRAKDAAPLARALLDGGIDAIELTLRTEAAIDAIRTIKRETPEMLVGAGTVLSAEQVRRAAEAGADFALAPGMNPTVVRAAQTIGLPFVPGTATPSDIERALECGCRTLKFFPAEPSGGLPYLKSMAAPYAHLDVRFIPLGGLNADNAVGYLGDPLVAAVGGSWIAGRKSIADGAWPTITALARQIVLKTKDAHSQRR